MTDIGTVVGPRHVAGSSVGHWVARYRLDTSDGSNVKTFTRVNSHSVSKYPGPDSPLLHIVILFLLYNHWWWEQNLSLLHLHVI